MGKMLAYEMIAVADHLRDITHNLIEPVLGIAGCPEHLITEGVGILAAVDRFADETADVPNIDKVQRDLLLIRERVEQYMEIVQKSC